MLIPVMYSLITNIGGYIYKLTSLFVPFFSSDKSVQHFIISFLIVFNNIASGGSGREILYIIS
jgi:hypothetical protein